MCRRNQETHALDTKQERTNQSVEMGGRDYLWQWNETYYTLPKSRSIAPNGNKNISR